MVKNETTVAATKDRKYPALSIKVSSRSDGSIVLTPIDVNRALLMMLSTTEKELLAKPLNKIFDDDGTSIDEWMEFVVKVKYSPYLSDYDQKTNETYEKTILQFYEKNMDWVKVKIIYDRDADIAVVEMSIADNNVALSSKWHWRELCLSKRLGDLMVSGSCWDIDLLKDQIYLSKVLARTLKISQDATVIPFEKFMALVHPDDVERVRNTLTDLSSGKTSFELRCVLPDGTTLYFTTYAMPSYGLDESKSRIYGRVINTTEIKQATHALTLSEKRFRGVVENSSNVYAVMDRSGRILYISPNCQKVFGYAPETMQGVLFTKFLAEGYDTTEVIDSFERALSHKMSTNYELRLLRTDGTTLWVRASTSLIFDDHGKMMEIGVVCRDIDTEKQYQEKLLYMARHDALTGAYNRSYFEEYIARLKGTKNLSLALIMVDLNGLKLVNDAFGHHRGDELLKETYDMIYDITAGCFISRIGGDEFVIIFECGSRVEAERLCAEIDEACEQTKRRQIPLSMSWGLDFSDDAGSKLNKLYEKAEERMYRKKLLDSGSLHSRLIASLKETLKSHNYETADHMQRMEKMVVAIGERLNLSRSDIDNLVLLASLHDIGKVAIPDHIISKPGKLSDKEWSIMVTHCEIGRRLAVSTQELTCIAEEILSHHERWDGTGYPQGKAGEDIPPLARVISVVDSYDVMTNKRPYKEPMSHEDAMQELRRCSGTQFDPAIVQLFEDLYGNEPPALNT